MRTDKKARAPKPITKDEERWLDKTDNPFRTRERQVAFYERYRVAVHSDKKCGEFYASTYGGATARQRWKKVMAAKDTCPLAAIAVAALVRAEILGRRIGWA